MSRPRPYPGYDVLANRSSVSWDDRTRAVVDARLNDVPPRRFLSEAEWAALTAAADRIVPQDGEYAPITPWIDQMLCAGGGDGFRRPDEPEDRAQWRQGLFGLDAEAVDLAGDVLAACATEDQDQILMEIQAGRVTTNNWIEVKPDAFFRRLVAAVVGVYYAQPRAWSEIGFGGPASPRGHVRLGKNGADPWEAPLRHG